MTKKTLIAFVALILLAGFAVLAQGQIQSNLDNALRSGPPPVQIYSALLGSGVSTTPGSQDILAAPSAPEATLNAVAWPPISFVDKATLGVLSAETKSTIAMSPLPVLFPSSPEIASKMSLITSPNWSSASYMGGQMFLQISATRIVYKLESISPSAAEQFASASVALRGTSGHIEWSDEKKTWKATWKEFNVDYMLEFGCGPDDVLCSQDDLRSLVNSLVFVGGDSVPQH